MFNYTIFFIAPAERQEEQMPKTCLGLAIQKETISVLKLLSCKKIVWYIWSKCWQSYSTVFFLLDRHSENKQALIMRVQHDLGV